MYVCCCHHDDSNSVWGLTACELGHRIRRLRINITLVTILLIGHSGNAVLNHEPLLAV